MLQSLWLNKITKVKEKQKKFKEIFKFAQHKTFSMNWNFTNTKLILNHKKKIKQKHKLITNRIYSQQTADFIQTNLRYDFHTFVSFI